MEKLISKENLKKGKKKGISIYFLYFPVSGKYSICSYNNIFHIFLLLIHSLYLLLHSISPHFYPTLILHFTFVPTNKSLTIKRLFIVISSFKLIIFGIIPIPIDRSIRRKGKGKERVARVTQEMYDFAPCVQAISMHASRPTYVLQARGKKGVGYATAVSPQGVRVLLDSTNPHTLAPHNPRSTPLFHAPSPPPS